MLNWVLFYIQSIPQDVTGCLGLSAKMVRKTINVLESIPEKLKGIFTISSRSPDNMWDVRDGHYEKGSLDVSNDGMK